MTDATIAAAVADATADAATDAQAADAQAAAQPADTTDAASTDQAEAAADKPADPPKPKRTDRHIAHLTAAKTAADQRAEAAERRAQAAEALLAAGRTDDPAKAATPAPRPAAAEVDRDALREEIRFNDRLAAIDVAGRKELGADQWEAAKVTLTGLGAVGNQAFLRALAETEHPAQIFAALADDSDALMDMLNKPPAAIGARLGKMDAGFAKPAAKALSSAPKPAAKVEGGGGAPPTDIYDPKMSMADFQKEMDKLLPTHLGGKRKAA